MRTKLNAIAALAVAAAIVTAVASAGSTSGRQRVAIRIEGTTFVLTAITSGAVGPDTGNASFCCWTQRSVTRNGQAIDIDNPQMTLVGKHGTLVTQNQVGWIDVTDGMAVFTGTWKVVSGTGAYAALAGGGRGAGLQLANGNTKSQFQGFITSK